MKPARYEASYSKSRPAVMRFDAYYPKGRLQVRLRLGTDVAAYIARQVAEDHAVRLSHINDYLAERAARPAPVVEPTNQLPLF